MCCLARAFGYCSGINGSSNNSIRGISPVKHCGCDQACILVILHHRCTFLIRDSFLLQPPSHTWSNAFSSVCVCVCVCGTSNEFVSQISLHWFYFSLSRMYRVKPKCVLKWNITVFPGPLWRTMIFSFVILKKNDDRWISILVIYWKKTGLLHSKISNHNIIYSSQKPRKSSITATKINFVVFTRCIISSYERCKGNHKFGNNTYPRHIRRRSNLGHIFRGGKKVCLIGREIQYIWIYTLEGRDKNYCTEIL